MNKGFHYFAFLLLFCFFSQKSFAQNVPDLIYYQFDAVGTSTVFNAASPGAGSANANIGGGMTQAAGGQFGGGLVGTGGASNSDFVNTGWKTDLDGAWTISFFLSNVAPDNTVYYFFGDHSANSFRCFTNGTAGTLSLIHI